MIHGKLEVTVASAKNLNASDYVGKNDPYVTLSVDGEQKQKTRVIDGGGANPTWDHSFIFNLTEGQDKLYLQVYDSDAGAASGDDFIGGTTIPLEHLFKSGVADEWYPLFGETSNETGSIHLKMTFSRGQGGPEFSNLGPEAGPIPTGYGLGAPPHMPPPVGSHHQPPPSSTTSFPSIHKENKESRDTKEHKDSKEHEKHETDWIKNAAIAGAAIAGAGALAYAGKKMYDKHEEKKHEKEDHEKREKGEKVDKKDKDHKDKDKKDKHEKEDKKDKDKKDKKDKEHKDKEHKDKDKKDKDKKDKDKKDKKDKHKDDD